MDVFIAISVDVIAIVIVVNVIVKLLLIGTVARVAVFVIDLISGVVVVIDDFCRYRRHRC